MGMFNDDVVEVGLDWNVGTGVLFTAIAIGKITIPLMEKYENINTLENFKIKVQEFIDSL